MNSSDGQYKSLAVEQVRGAALATQVFYVEYSGTVGGPTAIKAASTYLEDTILLYGEGIDSAQKASAILAAGADAIVVGNCFHDDRDKFGQTTHIASSSEGAQNTPLGSPVINDAERAAGAVIVVTTVELVFSILPNTYFRSKRVSVHDVPGAPRTDD